MNAFRIDLGCSLLILMGVSGCLGEPADSGVEGNCDFLFIPGNAQEVGSRSPSPSPKAGVVLRLKSFERDAVVNGVSDHTGKFRIPARPGKYLMTAELAGERCVEYMFSVQRDSRIGMVEVMVMAGKFAEADVHLHAGCD